MATALDPDRVRPSRSHKVTSRHRATCPTPRPGRAPVIRRALVAAALTTTIVFASNIYLSDPATTTIGVSPLGIESLPAAGVGGRQPDDRDPGSGVLSSQRAQSDRSRAIVVPPVVDFPADRNAEPRVGPGRSVVPADVTPLFVGDFDTGDFSQWTNCQSVFTNSDCDGYDSEHYSMQIVPGVGGGSAARFVVRPGDVPDFGGGERSEVAGHGEPTLTREGDERWYEFSMRFDEDFPAPADGSWFIVMQWHSGDGSPPLALEVSPDRQLYVGGERAEGEQRALGPVRRGEWVNYVLRVGFSRDASEGFVEGWENGVKTVKRHSRATMSSAENYLKMGIYRGNEDDTTAELLIDGLRIGAGR